MKNAKTAKELCSAAAKGNVDRLAQLHADGFDLNVSDYDGRTAMHLAASEGHGTVVRWLLQHGACCRAVDRFGGSALDDAKREKHPEVVGILTTASDFYDRERSFKQKIHAQAQQVTLDIPGAANVMGVAKRLGEKMRRGSIPGSGISAEKLAAHLAASKVAPVAGLGGGASSDVVRGSPTKGPPGGGGAHSSIN